MNQIAMGKKRVRIKMPLADKVFLAVVYAFLTAALLAVAYPLLFVVSASFSDPAAVAGGQVWIVPVRPTLMAYRAVLRYKNILSGFQNSFLYMSAGTALNLVFTVLAAYPLSRREFAGRGLFTFVFAFTMYVGGGIVPTYIIISQMKLLDTRWVMILPGLINVWHVIMCRTFFQSTIPDELYEAGQLDGCSDLGFMLRIVVPLSAPILAVLGLYTAVGIWNGYFSAMIYLSRQELFPLQVVLRSILMLGQIDLTAVDNVEAAQAMIGLSELLKYAVIVVASVPVMCLYPFVQRYFVKGVMIGSIKG